MPLKYYDYNSKSTWLIPSKYEHLEFLNHGGMFCQVKDKKTSESLVIKKISHHHLTKKNDFIKVLREIKLLKRLKNENIVNLVDIFMYRSKSDDNQIDDMLVFNKNSRYLFENVSYYNIFIFPDI
jgi:serine/threonine protein kinase